MYTANHGTRVHAAADLTSPDQELYTLLSHNSLQFPYTRYNLFAIDKLIDMKYLRRIHGGSLNLDHK